MGGRRGFFLSFFSSFFPFFCFLVVSGFGPLMFWGGQKRMSDIFLSKSLLVFVFILVKGGFFSLLFPIPSWKRKKAQKKKNTHNSWITLQFRKWGNMNLQRKFYSPHHLVFSFFFFFFFWSVWGKGGASVYDNFLWNFVGFHILIFLFFFVFLES